jgi:hypothetical protein
MNERDEILKTVAAATAMKNSSKKEFEFDVDMFEFQGHFKVKHPSLLDQMEIGVRRAKYLNGASIESLDTVTDNISYITATLSVVVKEAPTWFNIATLDSYEVLWEIYTKYKAWNDTFRRTNATSTDAGGSKASTDERPVENNEDVPNSDK